MWAVTPRFLDTIWRPHHVATVVKVTPPGGTANVLAFAGGSVTADRTQRIRRTASLSVFGGSALFETLSTPGAQVTIDHGFQWSTTERELVPMLRGELATAALQLGDGLIQIQVADRWQGLAATGYLNPFSPATNAGRVSTIITAVQDVYPGITIRSTATDTGTVGTAQAWTSRADMINSLATDGGMDAYFAPDGAFVLRDNPKITDPVAYSITTGDGGTLENLTRNRPLDRVYNAVVVTPATADKNQAWTQVTVQITDTNNPRHASRIGRTVPYRYQAPSLLTQAAAQAVAIALLDKVQGSTETLALGALANPALEPGDIIATKTPIDGGNDIANHFLDSATTDLTSGSMTCGTRANQELA